MVLSWPKARGSSGRAGALQPPRPSGRRATGRRLRTRGRTAPGCAGAGARAVAAAIVSHWQGGERPRGGPGAREGWAWLGGVPAGRRRGSWAEGARAGPGGSPCSSPPLGGAAWGVRQEGAGKLTLSCEADTILRGWVSVGDLAEGASRAPMRRLTAGACRRSTARSPRRPRDRARRPRSGRPRPRCGSTRTPGCSGPLPPPWTRTRAAG